MVSSTCMSILCLGTTATGSVVIAHILVNPSLITVSMSGIQHILWKLLNRQVQCENRQ